MSDCLFLLFNFGAVQVGDLPLDRLDGVHLVHGLDVQIDDQAALHVQEVRQHPVIQFRGHDLDKGHSPILPAHAERPAIAELKAAGCDEVLDRQTAGGQPVPRKLELLLAVHVEYTVHQMQALLTVHRRCRHAQPLEIVEDVGLNTLQPGLCRPNILRLDAKGQVLGLCQAVVAFCQLVLKHIGVFRPDTVEMVPPGLDGNALCITAASRRQVEERQLKTDGTVEIVKEIAPAVKNSGLVLILTELVVNVLELDSFSVIGIGDTADTVREHPLERDAVLSGEFLPVVPF